ncbi:MAG: ABC transporter ATP-binding protein [Acidobacteria bacterium]|nr:ABC transporter ATP-binding protein [Acidobacteriota bacterium]
MVRALDAVTLEVAAGAVCGLVGPNGAGKTTLLEILATILLPSAGRASVHGHDVAAHPARVRRCVTYAPAGGTAFFPRLTGRQNLEFFAALHDIPHREWRRRAAGAATQFQIAYAIDRRYSDGMRQRLGLARAAMSRAPVWLLDEPTRGLDPDARVFTQEALRDSARQFGTTVLISTHDLGEAEALCDQVVVLAGGRVVADRDVAALARTPGGLAATPRGPLTREVVRQGVGECPEGRTN